MIAPIGFVVTGWLYCVDPKQILYPHRTWHGDEKSAQAEVTILGDTKWFYSPAALSRCIYLGMKYAPGKPRL